MLITKHERHSLRELGNPFTEIHEWMDQCYEVVDNVAHRVACIIAMVLSWVFLCLVSQRGGS